MKFEDVAAELVDELGMPNAHVTSLLGDFELAFRSGADHAELWRLLAPAALWDGIEALRQHLRRLDQMMSDYPAVTCDPNGQVDGEIIAISQVIVALEGAFHERMDQSVKKQAEARRRREEASA